MGRIYQQTFIDTYSKLAFVKLYDRKNAITAADMLNDRVLPFFEEHGVPLLRILTDRGSEYCGNRESHEYALYLDLESIDHTRTKTRSPQTNGICERFHQTIQNEFYASAFRRKLYHSLEQLQAELSAADARAPFLSGGICFGRMVPMRLIPFQVTCLLGLDEASFPARDVRDPLNRVVRALDTRERRTGDPSRRDADRYLFLQLFASTGRVLYLSWCGMDPRGSCAVGGHPT